MKARLCAWLLRRRPDLQERLAVCRDRILSATSEDGLHWRREAGIRIDAGPSHPPVAMAFYCTLLNPVQTGGGHEMIYHWGCFDEDLQRWRTHFTRAVSADGLKWDDTEVVLSDGATASCARRILSPFILPHDHEWRMYFAGVAEDGVMRILSAVSTDRILWRVEEGTRLDPTQFQSAAGAAVGGLSDPSVVALPGKGYRMFVAVYRPDIFFEEIWSATSADGLSWQVEGACVLPGAPGMLRVVNNPHVVAVDGGWRMYFRGTDRLPLWSNMYAAFSRDGRTWTVEGCVLRFGRWRSYERHGVGFPHVVRRVDGTWRMYYTGYWGNLHDKAVLDYYAQEHERIYDGLSRQ